MNKSEMKNLMKAPFSEIIKAIKDKFVTRMKGQRHPKIVIKFTEVSNVLFLKRMMMQEMSTDAR